MNIRPIGLRHAPLLFAALFTGACVTTGEVSDVVERSNLAIVTELTGGASALDAAVTAGGADPAAWRDSVERIETFIAEHPGLTDINNALRVREAVVLMTHGEAVLAGAVFDEVDEAVPLQSERDRALYAAREPLLWWYGLGETLAPGDVEAGRRHLATLAAVADGLPGDAYVRRYLEQVRVRLALRIVRPVLTEQASREILDGAMARYERQFDDDQRAILAWHDAGADTDAALRAQLRNLRWFDYVPCAFDEADAHIRAVCEGPSCALYTPPWLASVDVAGACR